MLSKIYGAKNLNLSNTFRKYLQRRQNAPITTENGSIG